MKNQQKKDFAKCDWEGCMGDGEYLAPKSPRNLKDKHHFCLEHIRRYNKQWNFFSGMSREEIERFSFDSLTGHRPTTPRYKNLKYYDTEDLRERVMREFRFGFGDEPEEKIVPDDEKKALKVLGLLHPVTVREVKRRYKELAKRYHPDINGHGDEEKFKLINQAYSFLKSVRV